MENEKRNVPLADITLDPRLQVRAALDAETVADYAARYAEGVDLPAVTLFRDGATYWLADGFHRVESAKRAGLEAIPAEARDGSFRDALLFAAGANAAHGLRRTNADKRRAVEMLLADQECAGWSNCEIARRCMVGEGLVRDIRGDILVSNEDGCAGAGRLADSERCDERPDPAKAPEAPRIRTVTRNGIKYKMRLDNIGKGRRKASAIPAEEARASAAEADSSREAERRVRDRLLEELSGGVFAGEPGHLQWLDALNSARCDGALARGTDDYVPNCSACRDHDGGDRPFKRPIVLIPSEYTEGRDRADGPDVAFCPFCGEDYGFVLKPLEEGHAAVVCHSCGAVGPFGAPAEAAKALWNTRH